MIVCRCFVGHYFARSNCLPALPFTVIIRFITTMADAGFRKFVSVDWCLVLVPPIPCSRGKFPDLLCSVTYLCKPACALWLVSFGISPVWPPATCYLPAEPYVGLQISFHFGGITFTIWFRLGYFTVYALHLPGYSGSVRIAIRWRWLRFPEQNYDLQDKYSFL